MKNELQCDWCHKKIYRYPSQTKKHNFCSRECLAAFSNKEKNPDGYGSLKDFTNISKHMREMNQELNPSRMIPTVRKKIRNKQIGIGEGKSYPKFYGRHEHRVVAERMLGRKLRKGEVVHHIDGNKRNNFPENLMVFESQAEHARYHAQQTNGRKPVDSMEGGDAQ